MEITKSPGTVVESGGRLNDSLVVEGKSLTEHGHAQGEEALKDVVCGSIAGIGGKYIEYPLDTVKVRLQSQPDHLPLRYTGPLDCIKQSLKQDGILGIYRGISAPLFGAAVENSCLFFSYRIAQDAFRASGIDPELRSHPERELPYTGLLLCGGISGAITSLFLTPIELVKCKMQVPSDAPSAVFRRAGILSIIASVYRHQGLGGYWHGQFGTFIRETGGGVAWFGGFEGTKLLIRSYKKYESDDDLRVYQRMTAGAVAGMAYNFLFYPADTIKSRMQTEDIKQMTGGKSTFSTVGRAIWQQYGLKGLYRGCGLTVARSIPSNALIFTVYEELKKHWPERRRTDA